MIAAAVKPIEDVMGELHTAGCIIEFVANTMIERGETGPGETLMAALEKVLSALRDLDKQKG